MAENEKKTAETKPADEKNEKNEKNAKTSEKLDKDGLTSRGKENEALEAKIEEEMSDDEAGDLILEDERVSVPLTNDNAEFYRSETGLISMRLKNDNGETEEFERIVAVRCFPVTNPDEFISIREPDTKKKGRGKEIGMIRRLSEFVKEAQDLLNEELYRRYFTPEITKINSMKEKFGYTYWDVETSAGKITYVMNNTSHNIRSLEDKSVLIKDMDGNCFRISDPAKLDPQSLRRIEVYL